MKILSVFYVKLLNEQTNKQTNKRRVKYNLLGGGNNTICRKSYCSI